MENTNTTKKDISETNLKQKLTNFSKQAQVQIKNVTPPVKPKETKQE